MEDRWWVTKVLSGIRNAVLIGFCSCKCETGSSFLNIVQYLAESDWPPASAKATVLIFHFIIKFNTKLPSLFMRKAEIYPICNVDPSFDYSLLTVGDTTASNRNILLQRIELLELENMELRKRQEYLKMINATLLEALGNKQTLRDMINKLPNNSFAAEKNQKNDTNHTNKMTSFKKKAKQKKLELS